MSQRALARRHAPSLVIPTAGGPLVRGVPSLERVKVSRRGRFAVPFDMSDELRKKEMLSNFHRFIEWMRKEDGAEWDGGKPKLYGPFPHFEAKQPDMQVGDMGDQRPVARNVQEDLTGNGQEDYVIEACFLVREQITEVRSDVAADLFASGKPGVRPLRERN